MLVRGDGRGSNPGRRRSISIGEIVTIIVVVVGRLLDGVDACGRPSLGVGVIPMRCGQFDGKELSRTVEF